jgi:hypothetical protein
MLQTVQRVEDLRSSVRRYLLVFVTQNMVIAPWPKVAGNRAKNHLNPRRNRSAAAR